MDGQLIIHNYNIYNANDDLIGDGKEITLPDLSQQTADMSGTGILGTIKVPIPGMIDSLLVDIPFRMLSVRVSALFIGNKYATVKIRGALLELDTSEGRLADKPVLAVVRGFPAKLSPGKMKQGEEMGSGISIEAVYYKVAINGYELFELDKINQVYNVNGIDVLKDMRSMC